MTMTQQSNSIKNDYTLSGYDELWREMSYTGWLTMPRVLMHEMPDDWQRKMSELIREYDDTFGSNIPEQYWCDTEVRLKKDGKYIKTFEWITNYKYPDKEMFNSWKSNAAIH